MRSRRIVSVLGTRPEAIKLLPVQRLLARTPGWEARLIHTGQHRDLVSQVLEPFGLTPDADLGLMRDGQSLNSLAARAIQALDRQFSEHRPDCVLVQGDTTSAMAAALAAFHRGIPVGHVEAGLRSGDLGAPFPEEANRRLISRVASLHFAPTPTSRANLRREGTDEATIHVTGNTAIDALLLALDGSRPGLPDPGPAPRVLVTLHRRESWIASEGESGTTCPLDGVLAAIGQTARAHPGVDWLFPVHPNPRVRRRAERWLGDLANVALIEPLPYVPFVRAMASSKVVVSDSGGVQEECPSLGVPVLVVREKTERPEGLRAGSNTLVGLARDDVRSALEAAIAAPAGRPARIPAPNPFGDGRAAERIVAALESFFDAGMPRPEPFVPPLEQPSSDPPRGRRAATGETE